MNEVNFRNKSSFPAKPIFFYSGKGGVGKSTICVNTAYSFASAGYKVGIFDADLTGPSVAIMTSAVQDAPPSYREGVVLPGKYASVYVNSIGFFSGAHEGGYWQGKYLEGVLRQMLFATDWKDTHYLFIDMPPGNGDVHREIFAKTEGKAVIVSTPQDLSYADSIRAIEACGRFDVEVLGVVENMAFYVCSGCGMEERIFQGDTERALCEPYGLDILMRFPINSKISEASNKSTPFCLQEAKSSDPDISRFNELSQHIISKYPLEDLV